MGIYTHLSVKIFENNQIDFKEIELNGQDNSVVSLFLDSIIRHTNINFDRFQVLTDEENNLLHIIESEENLIYSAIIDSLLLLKIMDKIYSEILVTKILALNDELNTIEEFTTNNDEKAILKSSKIGDYMEFEGTFGMLRGILKVAKEFKLNVQIIIVYG